jgi:hypothetical protein
MNINKITLPWYSSEDDYKAVLALVPSQESTNAPPYKDFVSFVETMERRFPSAEQRPHRIELKPDALKTWCESKGESVCAASIQKYMEARAMEQFGGQ